MHTAVAQNHHQLPIQVNQHLVTFCTVAVFLYALTRLWIGAKISTYFEAAFLLPFYYIVFKNWWFFKKSKFTWLCIAMLAIPTIQFLVQYYQNPELAMKYQGVDKLFKLTFFIAAAFWLSHKPRLIHWFILANLIGLVILLLSQNNLSLLINYGLNGTRTNWGSVNAQFASFYTGIGIIAIASLFGNKQYVKKPKEKLALYIAYLTILAIICFIFLSTQTRSAMAALAISIVASSILFVLSRRKASPNPIKKPIFLLVSMTIVATLTTSLSFKSPINKTIQDWNSFKQSSQIIPDTLGGGRGELWKFGFKMIAKKPLQGWGGESRKDLITSSESLSMSTKNKLWHLHNSWLEFGLAYGILGAALLCLLFYFTLSKILTSINKQISTFTTYHFSLCSIIFMLAMNLFESYLFFWQGGYLLIWILTPIFAELFRSTLARKVL